MENQPDEKFTWVIKNFASLHSEKIYSDQFVFGSCRWRLLAYPKGNNKANHFSLYLVVADYAFLPIGWRRHVKVSFTIVNQFSDKLSQHKETQQWFDKKSHDDWGFTEMITLTELNARKGYLVNGELIVIAKVDVLEVVGKVDVSEETSQTNRETFLGGFAKILEKQWQGDLRLRALDSDEGAYISAHKLVLAARSEVFRLMFESDELKASAKLETVTISEMKHEEVEALVEFIYSDGSKLSEKGKQNVGSLFIAAHKYEILHLRDLCRNELISSLHLTNALDFYKLSLIPYERDLEVAALAFIARNFKMIINSKEFELFGNKNPDLTVKIVRDVVKVYISTM